MDVFKKCSCGKAWYSLDELIQDRAMYYNGISVMGSKTLFLFTHRGCNSTLAVSTELLDAHFGRHNEDLVKEAV